MECLEKPIWNKYTKEELEQISIPKPMEEVRKQVLHNWDAIAKPIDGLGSFETLTAQIGAITGEEKIDISKKTVLILCADNGIVEENIRQSGQEVTAAVARSIGQTFERMSNGGSGRSRYHTSGYRYTEPGGDSRCLK